MKICLSMIVKNEAHVILRSLQSVLPVIDTWVVVDTGSTDGTQEIIKNFFSEKGIEGKLVEHEWINFSDARNKALEESEKLGDFCLWIDADEELILINKNFKKKDLYNILKKVESGAVNAVYGSVNYSRKNIWKSNSGFTWKGPIHEFLSKENEGECDVIPYFYILVKAEGASWNNIKEKYENHAKVLEEWTKVDNDPRWVYYTAQSHKDSGNIEKAIEWYEKRILLDGYQEEKYTSLVTVAAISEGLKTEDEIVNLYLRAQTFDPLRAEAIENLIRYLQGKESWEKSYIFSKYAISYHGKNPFPYRNMFVDNLLYEYKLLEKHYLCCYWTNRISEGSWYFWKLLSSFNKLKIDKSVKNTILGNLDYYPYKEAIKYSSLEPESIILSRAFSASK